MPTSRVAVDLYNVTHKLLRLLRRRRPRTALTRERVSALLTLNQTGNASIKELAETEHVAHSTMSRLVAGLAATGLAATSNRNSDKRTSTVRLTSKGRQAVERDLRHITEPLAAAIADLPREDAAVLLRAVRVLDDVLSRVSSASAD
jgi:DNA-binding MarR family transcriptional regulator